MKALKVVAIAAIPAAVASFEGAVWTSGDLQQRLTVQGFVLAFAAVILGLVVWTP